MRRSCETAESRADFQLVGAGQGLGALGLAQQGQAVERHGGLIGEGGQGEARRRGQRALPGRRRDRQRADGAAPGAQRQGQRAAGAGQQGRPRARVVAGREGAGGQRGLGCVGRGHARGRCRADRQGAAGVGQQDPAGGHAEDAADLRRDGRQHVLGPTRGGDGLAELVEAGHVLGAPRGLSRLLLRARDQPVQQARDGQEDDQRQNVRQRADGESQVGRDEEVVEQREAEHGRERPRPPAGQQRGPDDHDQKDQADVEQVHRGAQRPQRRRDQDQRGDRAAIAQPGRGGARLDARGDQRARGVTPHIARAPPRRAARVRGRPRPHQIAVSHALIIDQVGRAGRAPPGSDPSCHDSL